MVNCVSTHTYREIRSSVHGESINKNNKRLEIEENEK